MTAAEMCDGNGECFVLAKKLAALERELKEARCHARVLAHAWTTDTRPTPESVKAGMSYAVDQR